MLSLPLVKTFEQDGIRELPPYLTALDLNSATTLDGSCFLDLPRSLEILKVQGISSVSKYQLADLPRRLTTLLLGAHVDFGSDAWPLLPITLSTWSIRHTASENPGWFTSDRLGDYRMYSGPYTRGDSKRAAPMGKKHKKAISKRRNSPLHLAPSNERTKCKSSLHSDFQPRRRSRRTLRRTAAFLPTTVLGLVVFSVLQCPIYFLPNT
jgi:hypothetical protein